MSTEKEDVSIIKLRLQINSVVEVELSVISASVGMTGAKQKLFFNCKKF